MRLSALVLALSCASAAYDPDGLTLQDRIALIEATSGWRAPAAMRYAVPANLDEDDLGEWLFPPDDALGSPYDVASSSSDSDEEVIVLSQDVQNTFVNIESSVTYQSCPPAADAFAAPLNPLELLFATIVSFGLLSAACYGIYLLLVCAFDWRRGDSASPRGRDYFDGRQASPHMGQVRGVYPAPPESPAAAGTHHDDEAWRNEPLIFEMPTKSPASPRSMP